MRALDGSGDQVPLKEQSFGILMHVHSVLQVREHGGDGQWNATCTQTAAWEHPPPAQPYYWNCLLILWFSVNLWAF